MKRFLLSLFVGIFCVASMTLSAAEKKPAAAGPVGSSQAAREEIVRRQESQQKARLLIDQGQKLYYEGKYQDAVVKLEEAVKLLPRAPATEIDYTRAAHALTDSYYRLADAAYRAGDNKKAKELAEKSLAYDSRNRSADSLLVKLRVEERRKEEVAKRPPAPPEEPRPSETPEFVAKKDQIKKLFREGKLLLNSGQYDEAEKRFHQILLLDPYNEDAQVFIGQVNKARLGYSQTSADLTRTRRLWEVTDAWVPAVPREVQAPTADGARGPIDTSGRQTEILKKLNNIIIPEINFREAVITDVIKFLSDESRKLDKPDGVGVNIVLQLEPVGEAPAPTPGGAPAPEGEAAAAPMEAGVRRISLTLRDIPLIEALRYVTSVAGLKFRIESSAVLVLPKDAPEGDMITRSYPVQSGAIKAVITSPTEEKVTSQEEYRALGTGGGTSVGTSDVKTFFTDAGVPFPPGSSIAYNDRTSTIIVRNTPENLETFEKILATLNVVPSQVEIEAKFIEISQTDLDELGFKWLAGQHQAGNFILEGGGPDTFIAPGGPPSESDDVTAGLRDSTLIQANLLDTLLGASTAGTVNQIASLRGILSDYQFTLVLKALSQKRSTDVLSAPKITTISGSSAQIRVIQEFIYPTEFTQPQVTAAGGGSTGGGAVGVTPSIPSSFKTRELGVLLNVTPTVGADGYTINLTLIPEVSEFQGFINYGSTFLIASAGQALAATNNILAPLFSSRNLTTSIVIWDGQTVVLGGLLREDIQKLDDKVPFLGDIPIVGRLFRTKTTIRNKRNLLVFVTARLIDPAGNPIHRQQSTALR